LPKHLANSGIFFPEKHLSPKKSLCLAAFLA